MHIIFLSEVILCKKRKVGKARHRVYLAFCLVSMTNNINLVNDSGIHDRGANSGTVPEEP